MTRLRQIPVHAGLVSGFVLAPACGTGELTVDDIVGSAPRICREICEARVSCESEFEGEYRREAQDLVENACTIACQLAVEEGLPVYTYSSEYSDELDDRLTGLEVSEYLNCLYVAGAFECDDGFMGIDTETECEIKDRCRDDAGLDGETYFGYGYCYTSGDTVFALYYVTGS